MENKFLEMEKPARIRWVQSYREDNKPWNYLSLDIYVSRLCSILIFDLQSTKQLPSEKYQRKFQEINVANKHDFNQLKYDHLMCEYLSYVCSE